MSEIGVGIALASATLHAAWNLRLKLAADPLRFAARALPVATAALTPVVAVAWVATGRPLLPWQGWLVAGASGLCELAYFHLLAAGYRRGEVSSVYPVARGTAPVLGVAIGLTAFGERLSLPEAVGAALLMAGVWLARPPATSRRALAPALATGGAIAAYTALDSIGVRTGPFWLYDWTIFAITSLLLLPWSRGGGPALPAGLMGGLTIGSYTLVLLALSLAPLALVAPAREVGVVLVAAWAILRLGERERALLKLSGAGLVVVGTGLLVA
ncbi:MAG TPA: EamA family transporter [Candidatus Dormibacteraeota bacterium]|nr:EamA family transporter [Candidatus Dormibacteraeota bacterium]